MTGFIPLPLPLIKIENSRINVDKKLQNNTRLAATFSLFLQAIESLYVMLSMLRHTKEVDEERIVEVIRGLDLNQREERTLMVPP